MISIEDLAEILNREITKEFLETALELYNDGCSPIDPEDPHMEEVLDKIVESVHDLVETLPIHDKYD